MMDKQAQAIGLIRQALDLLEGTPAQKPSSQQSGVQAKPDEVTLEGYIFEPQFRHVGEQNIPLYTAKLEVGSQQLKVQAWRKVAEWGMSNLTVGAHVRAMGRWEEHKWTSREGEPRTTNVFSVRAFEPL